MVIFHSYVKLPEGSVLEHPLFRVEFSAMKCDDFLEIRSDTPNNAHGMADIVFQKRWLWG